MKKETCEGANIFLILERWTYGKLCFKKLKQNML